MAQGDQADFAGRLRALLPATWFPDSNPVLAGALNGVGAGLASVFKLIAFVRQQTRLATMSGQFLDLFATDFFGFALLRRAGEMDAPYKARIRRALLADKGTRAAVIAAVTDLTGIAPDVFEPQRPADTGALNTGTFALGGPGRLGSRAYPFQVFITATRPVNNGAASNLAGLGTPVAGLGTGLMALASAADLAPPVSDADIYAAIAGAMPVATIAWTRLQ